MEDLRKLRPTLQVIVENHAAIFKEARPAQQPRAEKSSSESQMMRLVYTESGTLLPSMESYSTEDDSIASTPVAYSPPSGDNSVVDFRKKKGSKLELHVSVSATADVNDASFSQLNQVSLRPVNFQSKEWNVIEYIAIFGSMTPVFSHFMLMNHCAAIGATRTSDVRVLHEGPIHVLRAERKSNDRKNRRECHYFGE